MAIYNTFKHWCHYLEGAGTPIDIITNHHNLQYFSMMKVLSAKALNRYIPLVP